MKLQEETGGNMGDRRQETISGHSSPSPHGLSVLHRPVTSGGRRWR